MYEEIDIAFKVVSEHSRLGTNAMIHGVDRLRFVLDHYPHLKPFFPRYIKGFTVSAVPFSIGICCFRSYRCAEEFIHMERLIDHSVENPIIVQVKPFGEPKVGVLLAGCGDDLKILEAVYTKKNVSYRAKPFGTVCFEAVKVLE